MSRQGPRPRPFDVLGNVEEQGVLVMTTNDLHSNGQPSDIADGNRNGRIAEQICGHGEGTHVEEFG